MYKVLSIFTSEGLYELSALDTEKGLKMPSITEKAKDAGDYDKTISDSDAFITKTLLPKLKECAAENKNLNLIEWMKQFEEEDREDFTELNVKIIKELIEIIEEGQKVGMFK